LVGFELFFTGARDHNLDRIGVWFDQGNDLHVVLRDKSGDDTFGYLVDFVVIRPIGLDVYRDSASGTANGRGRANMDFILRGWEFNFRSDDHRIRDFGVVPNQDNLNVSVIYADKGSDDSFDWRIDYAHVRNRVLAPPR
jgi:hypothetical protein